MYSHRITYVVHVAHLGDISHSFRTTADAIEMHLSALGKRGASLIVVEQL